MVLNPKEGPSNCSLTEGNNLCVMWPIRLCLDSLERGPLASAKPARSPILVMPSLPWSIFHFCGSSKRVSMVTNRFFHPFTDLFIHWRFIKHLPCAKLSLTRQHCKNWETSCWLFWLKWGKRFKRARRKLLSSQTLPFNPNFWAGAHFCRAFFPRVYSSLLPILISPPT